MRRAPPVPHAVGQRPEALWRPFEIPRKITTVAVIPLLRGQSFLKLLMVKALSSDRRSHRFGKAARTYGVSEAGFVSAQTKIFVNCKINVCNSINYIGV